MVRSITGWIGFRIWCEALYYGRQEHDVEVEVLGEEEHDNIDNCPTYRERQPCWTDRRLSHQTARAALIPLD